MVGTTMWVAHCVQAIEKKSRDTKLASLRPHLGLHQRLCLMCGSVLLVPPQPPQQAAVVLLQETAAVREHASSLLPPKAS